MSTKKFLELTGVKYPIIQAGMVWVSGSKLAAAASNAGALGVIGAGSMKAEVLDLHLTKIKTLTNKPYAVNMPLLYEKAREQIDLCLSHGVKIFITSAGSPKLYTDYLKSHGALVIHVTSTPELAKKCEEAKVDMIVAEGFEAGGHNGRDEITTLALIPQVVDAVNIPVVAAGGIADGRQMLASFALGASAVQIGTRFVATVESSAHKNFKQALLNTKSGSTKLLMKNLVPVRLLDNKFSQEVQEIEKTFCDPLIQKEKLALHLGKGRAKKGMLEGDLSEGELEIGQVTSMLKDIPTCDELVKRLISQYNDTVKNMRGI